MNTALVLIDIQNDYFPGGKMELEGSEPASERAERLLNFFRDNDLPLVHIQHIATQPTATFFAPNTEGVRHRRNVQPRAAENVFQKHFPNSFRETPLLDHLRAHKIDRVVMAGMMTHMCVDATVRAATDFGFQSLTASDACATRALMHAGNLVPAAAVHDAFLAALNGAYGRVMTTDEILSQLRSR
jgi:nicotinamidase-related amidase